MLDPFKRIANAHLWPALILFLVSALVLLAVMSRLDAALTTVAAPGGIVSFEMAGNLETATRIVASWKMAGKIQAAFSLGLDYLFLIVYALFISIACVLIGRKLTPKYRLWANLGYLIGWAQFPAALLDGIENFALIRVILGSQSEVLPLIARWCAVVKFGIVGAGLIYILTGLTMVALMIIAGRMPRQENKS